MFTFAGATSQIISRFATGRINSQSKFFWNCLLKYNEWVLNKNFPPLREIGFAENAKTAVLYIYNMQGHQIDSHETYQTGSGNISISGNTMQAGMYLYTLIVDKQEVDTKKMILTD